MFVEDSVVTCIKCIRKDPSVIKLNHKRNKGPMFFRNQISSILKPVVWQH